MGKLKARLTIRRDFAFRALEVPPLDLSCFGAAGLHGEVIATAALAARLARGAICLLEFILASLLRSRYRSAFNAILEHHLMVACKQRRSQCLPRAQGNGRHIRENSSSIKREG